VAAAAEFEAVSRRVPEKSRIRRVIVGINAEQSAIMLASAARSRRDELPSGTSRSKVGTYG